MTRRPFPLRPVAALAALAALALALPAARADVLKATPTGFEISFRHEVQATSQQVYDAFLKLPQWWSNQHTWSGQAANLVLEPQAGGCWCERWDGRSVMHGQVVWVNPGSLVRANAWLGPLQERAVAGVFTMATATQDGVVRLRVTYRAGGSEAAELDKLAPVVDRVLGEQVQRLLKFIATGRPE